MQINQNRRIKVKERYVSFVSRYIIKDLCLSTYTMPLWLNNCRFHVNLNSKNLLCPTRHVRFRSLTVQSSGIISSDPAMASNSVRVAAAQMTSINDLAANFATCSRLVKVYSLFNFSSATVFAIYCLFVLVFIIDGAFLVLS